MRPARPVTASATVTVSIAALALFAAGQPAYAGATGTARTDAAAMAAPVDAAFRESGVPRESEVLHEGALVPEYGVPREQGGGDGSGGGGHDTPFGGLNVPSLLDSVGGLNAVSGLGTARNDEGSNDGGSRNASEGGGSSRHEDSSGRDSGSGRDGSSSGHDDSSGHDSGSGRGDSAGSDAPRGHVKTGVGGSVRSDTTQIAVGAGVLAGAAAGGAWLLRRRASGTQGVG